VSGAPANVLISSAGRRVALLEAFQRSAAALSSDIRVLVCDASPLSAALQRAERGVVVPRCADVSFVPAILEFCEREDIGLIIPTIDTELPVYAAAAAEFAAAGVTVAVSSPETVAIGGDKGRTHEWLTSHAFPTVKQWSLPVASDQAIVYPALAKPIFGSASIGIRRIAGPRELAEFDPAVPYILQQIATGIEYTVDVLVANGKALAAVPRERFEVRAGEISKGATRRHAGVEQLAVRISEALPGAFGVLNIQMFVEPDGPMNVIEINPRFGGGFPLSYQAGADYPRWLMEHAFGYPSTARNDWTNDLVMLRFDEAVFVSESALRR